MLRRTEDMPDGVNVYPLVASRPMNEQEQSEIVASVNKWALEWSTSVRGAIASAVQTILDGRVIVWAAGAPADGSSGYPDLTGTDLDPLFRQVEAFALPRDPPLTFDFGEGFMVGDDVVTMRGDRLRQLIHSGHITKDTLMFHTAPVGLWRAGRFAHPLSEDPDWLDMVQRATT